MKHSKLAASLLLSVAVGGLLFTGCGDSDNNSSSSEPTVTFRTNIIHINDHHSHLDEEDIDLTLGGISTNVALGGFPRVVTKIKELQSSEENAVTLHAGDALSGTLYYTLFQGQADAEMMNLVTWDAFELGNHEFDEADNGVILKAFLETLDAPTLAANVVAPSGHILEGLWEPYRIVERDGEQIGIIGIDIAQKTQMSSNPDPLIEFLDETETVQKYADELNDMGVDKVIVVSHYGYDNEVAMAKNLSGVDAIIGGDSHTLLGGSSMEEVGLSPTGDYPTQVTGADGNIVCVAQAWNYSYVVGDLEIGFDDDGNVLECSGTPHVLIGDTLVREDESEVEYTLEGTELDEAMSAIASYDFLSITEPDSEAETLLAGYSGEVDELKNEVIGSASETLGHNRIPGDTYDGENTLPLGSDIAPIVSKSFYDLSNRADACIQNAGGVRVAIPAGEVTVGDAYTLLPFSNTLYELEMSGAEIKQVLEDALYNIYEAEGSTGSFPYAYGLRYDVDVTQEAYSRISGLEVMDRETKTWSDIDMDKDYVIVTNSYTAGGKDGYTTFATAQEDNPGVDTYLDYALSFVKYVEAKTAAGESVTKLPTEEHCIKSFTAE